MSRVEIFRGQARRRWSDEAKRRLVAETLVAGATVHAVAQRHGVNTSQLFIWRKRFRTEPSKRAMPLDKPRGPEVVASVVAMLASEDGVHINGESIRMDGGTLA